MSRHMGTGYHGETRPDAKMGHERHWSDRVITSSQNWVRKHRAKKKRRQRDSKSEVMS